MQKNKSIMKKIFGLAFIFLINCNNLLAQSTEEPKDGFFNTSTIIGGIVGAIAALLVMRYRDGKKGK